MPLPTPTDVHINAPLTNISVAYIQAQSAFIAAQVFPIVRVNKQSDLYFRYSKADWHRDEAQERAPATESAGGGWRMDTDDYFARVYAYHKDVDDQTRANADMPIEMDRDATEFVTQKLLLRREKVWSNTYFQAGIWGIDLQGVAAAPGAGQFLQWDQANSTPIEDVTTQAIAIAEQTGFRPNRLVLTPYVYNVLRHHPDVLDRIKYTQRGVVTTEILAALFDVEQVVIPWGIENIEAEGLPEVEQFVFGKHAPLATLKGITWPTLMVNSITSFSWSIMSWPGAMMFWGGTSTSWVFCVLKIFISGAICRAMRTAKPRTKLPKTAKARMSIVRY